MFSTPFAPTGRAILSEELYEFLKDAIVSGELGPRERLVEDAIARATSVSRTPVREALRNLKASGLIELRDRGYVVTELSGVELRDIWSVMETLQELAAGLAASHRSTVDLVRLQDIVRRARIATDDGDVPAIVALNREFHDAVHNASGNRFLADLINSLTLRIERNQDFTEARRREQAQDEHVAVLNALERQDSEGAQQAIADHLRNQLASAMGIAARLSLAGPSPALSAAG